MKYFAYGSNMNPDQIRCVSPKAVFISTVRLQSHRLDFTRFSKRRCGGVADIVPDPNAETWGVLYEVEEEDLKALDKKEGVPVCAYKRYEVDVVKPSGEMVHS
ncbi:MAG: gamma-glutamylcyclotransferase, partial [Chloroflexi bacterium]|nr:gamma-glutamylcyclotransferase [Chloroflexota bacterium]